MKFFYLLVLSITFVPALALAETITNFSAVYTINADATVDVVETIDYDFGGAQRHGIFRDLKTTHAQPETTQATERIVKISDVSVMRDGQVEPFVSSGDDAILNIKIGRADVTISDQHRYTIAYTLKGALSYGPSGSELYWNITGDGWSVPITSAEALLKDPDGIFLPQRACYRGEAGETASCQIATTTDGDILFSTYSLAPGSGLTIAQALDAQRVAEVILERPVSTQAHSAAGGGPMTAMAGFLMLGFGSAALGLCALLINFLVRRKHRVKLPVIAQYEPFEQLNPMYTGLLIDEKLDPRDITAGILTLAERGYLKIHHTEKQVFFVVPVTDYEIELRKEVTDESLTYETKTLDLLSLTEVPVGTRVSVRDIAKSLSRQRANQTTLSYLRTTLKSALVADGYFEEVHLPRSKKTLAWLGVWSITAILLSGMFKSPIDLVWLPLVIVPGLLLLVTVRRRTEKGFVARNHLLGFKEFLSVTDAERFAFHNAPEKSPELFMQYLPYAVAFGVEKEWAQAFKDITIPNPEWYSGTAHYAQFSAVDFTSSLSALSSSVSQSSGTHGSSGRGFSGGGGGGGGGGSW